MIKRRRCDVSMAKAKGVFGACGFNCANCLCCIEMDGSGNESHVAVVHGGDPGILARNLGRYSPRTETPARSRRIGPFFGGKRI